MDIALFLSYFFPPLGGGGVQRSAKFAKYLPDYGWHPVVITVEPNRRNTIEQGLDLSLLPDIQDKIETIRCKSLEFSNLYYTLYRLNLRRVLFELEKLIPFFHMDYKIGWYRPALNAAKDIIAKLPIKVVYSTSPPYASHLLGHKLQKLFDLPWVADFRDPWTQIGTYRPPTPLHAWIDNKLEKTIMEKADAIIANTELNRLNLISKYQLAKKIYVIPNGFDPADFSETQTSAPPSSERFLISCLGKFYDMPDNGVFLRAYRQLVEHYGPANFSLKLIGWCSRNMKTTAKALLKEGTWEISDRLDHKTAIQIMRESSLLLVNLPNELCIHWVPGKLYEYIAANKPILFIGPQEGEAAKIINATRSGKVVKYDEESICEALKHFYLTWQKGASDLDRDREAISQFDRCLQTGKLAHIFYELIAKRKIPELSSS